jgi:hypothetical protein
MQLIAGRHRARQMSKLGSMIRAEQIDFFLWNSFKAPASCGSSCQQHMIQCQSHSLFFCLFVPLLNDWGGGSSCRFQTSQESSPAAKQVVKDGMNFRGWINYRPHHARHNTAVDIGGGADDSYTRRPVFVGQLYELCCCCGVRVPAKNVRWVLKNVQIDETNILKN